MQTNYQCACGARINIESQGELPVAITKLEQDSILIGGVRYPLKNEQGESLKNVLNGKAEYWTPPPIPVNPPAPAPSEPAPTH
jgi:hypothetical protein